MPRWQHRLYDIPVPIKCSREEDVAAPGLDHGIGPNWYFTGAWLPPPWLPLSFFPAPATECSRMGL